MTSWTRRVTAGVPVRLDASLWLVAILVAWSFWIRFATGRSVEVAGTMALAATACFFASVLAHELAHALEARRRGLAVGGITLYVFGGATAITSEIERPGDEFALTIAGPWTSITLGSAFGLVAYAAGTGGLGALATVAGELGWLNLALGLFNLLPGAPLDGGRLLDAAVWRLTGDPVKAAAVAAGAGIVLGSLVILAGLLLVLTVAGGFVGGLWLALIGWFLVRAARSERAAGALRARLAGVPAGALAPAPPVVPADATLAEAAEISLRAGGVEVLVVVDAGRVLGLLVVADLGDLDDSTLRGQSAKDALRPVRSFESIQWSEPAVSLLARLDKEPIVVLDGDAVRSVATRGGVDAALALLAPAGRGQAGTKEQRRRRFVAPAAAPRPRPAPPRRASVWLGAWAASGAVVVSAAALVPMPLVELAPGPVFDMPALVTTAGPRHLVSGKLLATSVSLRSPSALGAVRALFEPHHDLVGISSIVPVGVDPADYEATQRQLFEDTTGLAAAVALRSAGYEVEIGAGGVVILGVVAGGPADGRLEVGDVVTAVGGREISNLSDLVAELRAAPANSAVNLEVLRHDRSLEVLVRPAESRDLGRVVLGVAAVDAVPQVALPFPVSVSRHDLGGPSAGLMTALSVYALTTGDDLSGGRVLAGTGTIDRNGVVGPVGGVSAKVVAAADAGARIFLVPASEAATARAAAGKSDLEIVPVGSFEGALRALGASARSS